MAKVLNVYFHEKIIGHLLQDDHGEMSFSYTSDWVNDPNSMRISCSLPLQNEAFKRKACHAFFGGILPEENNRKIIAKNLSISPNNDFSMLEKIGGECAGALSFISKDIKLNSSLNNYHELKSEELANILRQLPSRPLLAGEKDVRLSLAGVQDKIAIYKENDTYFIPLDSSPSTHILKPDLGIYEGVIFNEAFCLQLARKIGLSVADAEIKKIEDINYLLIKRYDRILNSDTNKIIRLHQEDFCQALGIASSNKYQNEGGPSLKQCFELIRRESSIPILDLQRLINAVIFNFLIGNCDAHGKNFSFLYLDQLQLAPLYDLVCTLYYEELNQDMAMKLGGEYKILRVNLINFDKLADEIGFSKPEVNRRIFEVIDTILDVLPTIEITHEVQQKVSNLIKIRCLDFAKGLNK
ncbi:MAG: HipA domain-containing protein [Gammaproteobacteria bacterium]